MIFNLLELRSVHLVATPLMGVVRLVYQKHIECKLVIEHSKLVAVVHQPKSPPKSDHPIAHECFFELCVVFSGWHSKVHILGMWNNTAVTIPACKNDMSLKQFFVIHTPTSFSCLPKSVPPASQYCVPKPSSVDAMYFITGSIIAFFFKFWLYLAPNDFKLYVARVRLHSMNFEWP
jgi:hypothetical protein